MEEKTGANYLKNIEIFGGQYGDEGKGKVSAYFSRYVDWSVRFNGGPNAGHTVVKDGVTYKLHHLPAGILYGNNIALDTGMVVNAAKLFEELAGIPKPHGRICISENVHLIQYCHIEEDTNGSGIGTTSQGIAYVYRDRALKIGVRVGDHPQLFEEKGIEVYSGLAPIGEFETALFESAQGLMLDVDYGCYPYCTSSSIMPNHFYDLDKKIMVMKAYTSRVGGIDLSRPLIDWLADAGSEFGTTTGRRRKCYWNDMREIRYALDITRPDEVVLTKLDILDGTKPHIVDLDGKDIEFSGVHSYLDYLVEHIPELVWISRSPDTQAMNYRKLG